jgi:multidrug efflux pump subunit AcrA (membrane-fusion protein)
MKRSLFALLFLAGAVFVRAEEPEFSHALSSADFKAAGLDRLSPEERVKLDKFVQAFAEAQVTGAKKSADVALEAKRAAEAEAKAAQQEARIAKEEAKAAKIQATESKASDRGFFAKAKVLIVPGTKIEYAEVRSTVEGTFEGWTGKTIFRLANGQRWQVTNGDEDYFVPPRKNVEVQIRPAALGGYWMYFPELGKQVRVKLLTTK